jgi:L-arabinose transport system ATP-binding protein
MPILLEGLQFEGVSKTFPGVRALDAVTFDVRPGSVHALLGENGAGKSTLLKILGGAYRPDAGALRVGGQPRHFRSPAEAYRAGVAVIHQELHLAPEMTVEENLYLGHMPHRAGWIDRRALREAARRQLELLEEDIGPDEKVGRLPIAQRQMIEIAKALAREASVIAFDEPTSSLSAREVEKLFAIIRRLRGQGRVILYVTHRMEEVFALCDRATVLRDGRHIETFPALAGVTPDLLIERMVGRDLADIYRYAPRPHGGPALEAEGLWGPGLSEPVSLTVKKGEIVGLFGLVGAGRTELLKLIYGAAPLRSGHIRIAGLPAILDRPATAIRGGVVLCPEDRKKEGIVPIRSVLENINLSARRSAARLGFFIDERWERDNAGRQVAALRVKTPSLQQPVMNLSGGNQQKVVLGRWLSERIRVILLDEPTRGIDVGARSEIYAIINELAASGAGVLMASSDLPEVLGVADRVIVMRQGRIGGELSRAEATEERCLKLALPAQEDRDHG